MAQAGAAAALTGLLFVALSFNLDRIAADRTWLSRAGTGLIYLAQPVIVSLVALFPRPRGSRTNRPQPRTAHRMDTASRGQTPDPPVKQHVTQPDRPTR